MLRCDDLSSGECGGRGASQSVAGTGDANRGGLENLLIELLDAVFTLGIVDITSAMLCSGACGDS